MHPGVGPTGPGADEGVGSVVAGEAQRDSWDPGLREEEDSSVVCGFCWDNWVAMKGLRRSRGNALRSLWPPEQGPVWLGSKVGLAAPSLWFYGDCDPSPLQPWAHTETHAPVTSPDTVYCLGVPSAFFLVPSGCLQDRLWPLPPLWTRLPPGL